MVEIEIPLENMLYFYGVLFMVLAVPIAIGLTINDRKRRDHATDREQEGFDVPLLIITLMGAFTCALLWWQLSPWRRSG